MQQMLDLGLQKTKITRDTAKNSVDTYTKNITSAGGSPVRVAHPNLPITSEGMTYFIRQANGDPKKAARLAADAGFDVEAPK